MQASKASWIVDFAPALRATLCRQHLRNKLNEGLQESLFQPAHERVLARLSFGAGGILESLILSRGREAVGVSHAPVVSNQRLLVCESYSWSRGYLAANLRGEHWAHLPAEWALNLGCPRKLSLNRGQRELQ